MPYFSRDTILLSIVFIIFSTVVKWVSVNKIAEKSFIAIFYSNKYVKVDYGFIINLKLGSFPYINIVFLVPVTTLYPNH